MDATQPTQSNLLPIGGIILGLLGTILGALALSHAARSNQALIELQQRLERAEATAASATRVATERKSASQSMATGAPADNATKQSSEAAERDPGVDPGEFYWKTRGRNATGPGAAEAKK
jgi:hypothetical protein